MVKILSVENSQTKKSSCLGAEKLEVHIIDFDLLSNDEEHIRGDILFSALGTTMKKAKTKEHFFHIDHDYNVSFAKLAQKRCSCDGIVSAVVPTTQP